MGDWRGTRREPWAPWKRVVVGVVEPWPAKKAHPIVDADRPKCHESHRGEVDARVNWEEERSDVVRNRLEERIHRVGWEGRVMRGPRSYRIRAGCEEIIPSSEGGYVPGTSAFFPAPATVETVHRSEPTVQPFLRTVHPLFRPGRRDEPTFRFESGAASSPS